MHNVKVGDKIRIINNLDEKNEPYHYFELGEIVEVSKLYTWDKDTNNIEAVREEPNHLSQTLIQGSYELVTEDELKPSKPSKPSKPLEITSIQRGEFDALFKCPSCGGDMEYLTLIESNSKDERNEGNVTHVWSCEDCPMVFFEYYDDKDSARVKELLDNDYSKERQEAYER